MLGKFVNIFKDLSVNKFWYFTVGFSVLLMALLVPFVLFVLSSRDKNEKFDSVDSTSTEQASNKNKCKITGCSHQLCVEQDEDLFTSCEYKEEYACYSKVNAVCEVQEDGKCGWTQSPELLSCLNESRKNF